MKKGTKFDNNKDRWDLLPLEVIEEVVKVLTYGTQKYGDNNWKGVKNLQERYYAACLRHLSAWRKGELLDSETKFSHLSHAICSLIFVSWKDKYEK